MFTAINTSAITATAIATVFHAACRIIEIIARGRELGETIHVIVIRNTKEATHRCQGMASLRSRIPWLKTLRREGSMTCFRDVDIALRRLDL
jgi:hypothetical protein